MTINVDGTTRTVTLADGSEIRVVKAEYHGSPEIRLDAARATLTYAEARQVAQALLDATADQLRDRISAAVALNYPEEAAVGHWPLSEDTGEMPADYLEALTSHLESDGHEVVESHETGVLVRRGGHEIALGWGCDPQECVAGIIEHGVVQSPDWLLVDRSSPREMALYFADYLCGQWPMDAQETP